jgi:hypothetical protein
MLALKTQEFVSTSAEHYDLLHSQQRGVSIVWEKTAAHGKKSWHKLAPDSPEIPFILAAQQGKEDRYVTVNEFHAWRVVRQLKSLRSLFVDIDASLQLDELLDALACAKLPAPSFVMHTGRGLHAYWLHAPVPSQALPVWQRCQDTIIAALASAGADKAAKDCARVLRLAGSVNSKTGTHVHGLVLDPEPWIFRDLCDEILGYRIAHEKPKATVRSIEAARAKTGARQSTGSIYDRWYLVYQDLLAIGRWYDFGGIPPGHRNNWLFASAVALSWFAHPETLEAELIGQARVWTPYLTEKEVRAAYQSPLERARMAAEGKTIEWQGMDIDPRYRMRRSTLYELLQPIIPPALERTLRAVISDETRKEHKRETNGSKQTREAYLAENNASTLKPWAALGISRATYYRRKALGTL